MPILPKLPQLHLHSNDQGIHFFSKGSEVLIRHLRTELHAGGKGR